MIMSLVMIIHQESIQEEILRKIYKGYKLPLIPMKTQFIQVIIFLNPNSSYNIAKNDIKSYGEYNIQNLALDTIGNKLFSYYDNS